MVAEAHRILMRGGVFLYPRDSQGPGAVPGRLRLLYEANPIGFLMEQAGGRASTGRQPVLAVTPTSLHQRIGLIFGSRNEVERIERYHHDAAAAGAAGSRCSASAACSATAGLTSQETHHVRTPPDHRHHRLVRRRHHLGHPHLREHLPAREASTPRSSRATASTATTARR